MHGGGPPVVAGRPLDHAYKTENVEMVRAGCCNLAKHIANMRAYGVPVVVALNKFASDTDAELEAVKAAALEAGEHCPVAQLRDGDYARVPGGAVAAGNFAMRVTKYFPKSPSNANAQRQADSVISMVAIVC